MFILYAIPLGLLLGYALHGRISGLATLHLDGMSVIFAALLIQTALFGTPLGDAIGLEAATALYLGTTASVLIALAGNMRTPGIRLAVAGAAANLLVMVVNNGRMPASAAAYAQLGWGEYGSYTNTAFIADARLAFLGDVIPLPAWLPFTNVVSVGDLLIGAGIAATIALAMRRSGSTRRPRIALA